MGQKCLKCNKQDHFDKFVNLSYQGLNNILDKANQSNEFDWWTQQIRMTQRKLVHLYIVYGQLRRNIYSRWIESSNSNTNIDRVQYILTIVDSGASCYAIDRYLWEEFKEGKVRYTSQR